MTSQFWNQVARVVISTEATVGFCACILLVALWAWWRVAQRSRYARNEVANATALLTRVDGPDMFPLSFQRLDDGLKGRPLLAAEWHRFSGGLLPPHKGVPRFRTAIDPDDIFTLESVLGRAINLRLVQAVPSYLTGLGILGTFLGLVAGLSVAAGGLAGSEEQERISALRDLLQSAGLAFSTSMVGLATSILLSVVERWQFGRVAEQLDRWNRRLRELVPVVSAERINAEQLLEQEKQTAQLQLFNTDLAVSIATALDARISDRLMPVLERLEQGLKQLQERQARVGEELLRDVGHQISEAMTGAAGKEAESIRRALGEVTGTVEAIQNLLGEANTLLASFRSTVDVSERMLVDLGAAHEALKATAEPLQATSEKMAATTDAIGSQVERISESSHSIERAGHVLRETQNALVQSWASYESRFAGVDEALARSIGSIQDGMNLYADKVRELNQGLDHQFAKALADLSGVIGEFHEQVEDFRETLDRWKKP